MKRLNKQERAAQAAWYRDFELAVIAELPEQRGRIVWVDADYMKGTGLSAADAARRYIDNRKGSR